MSRTILKEYPVISIQVGKPKAIVYQGKELLTGIFKQPVDRPLFLSYTNFEGDGQADTVNHGGADKAVCVYCHDHYTYWQKQLNRPLEAGAFGENLTIAGLKEEEIHIGDIFQLDEAIVQVSQPRYPCHKLSKKHDVPDFPLQVIQTGYSGFYLRVLQEGMVSPTAMLRLIERHPQEISVAYVNQVKNIDKDNQAALKQLIELDVLAQSWRDSLLKRLV